MSCWCETEDGPGPNNPSNEQLMTTSCLGLWKKTKWSLPRTKCTTAVNLFLAHRYAAVLIILLAGMGPDPRPVWCNAPLPLCNQAQTRWLKVLLQLPVWKALSYPHQRHYSHGLQTPLGSTDMTPKQSGWLFLPPDKNPSSAASAHWRQLNFFPPPPQLYQVSRTVGLFEFGTDGIAGYSMVDCTLSKKREE